MRLQPRDWHDSKTQLLEFAQAAVPHPCVFATLSGADLYGFPSDDSDYDVRAAHVLSLRDVIVATLQGGSWDRVSGVTVKAERKPPGLFADLVSHDIGKVLHLALKGNGYVLEQISSSLVLITSAWHEELKDIAQKCIIRRLYYHYRGFFTGQEKLYHNVGTKRVKGLLYQYRVAMTGIMVLETGRLEANINRLNEYFRLVGVDELVARKVGGEDAFLVDDTPYLREIETLRPRLETAYERSSLPDQASPETRAAAEDFLIRCRMELGQKRPLTPLLSLHGC